MRKGLLWTCLLLGLGISYNATAQIPQDIASVRKCYDEIKVAVMAQKGSEVLPLVDDSTIQYYTNLLDWTLYANDTTIDKMNMLDKLNVLNLRHRVSAETLKKLDGKKLFKLTVDSGYVAKGAFETISLGHVEVKFKEGKAMAQAMENGAKIPLVFHFVRDKKQWKMNLAANFKSVRRGIEEQVKISRQGPHDYVIMYLVLETGRNVDPNILNPLFKKK